MASFDNGDAASACISEIQRSQMTSRLNRLRELDWHSPEKPASDEIDAGGKCACKVI